MREFAAVIRTYGVEFPDGTYELTVPESIVDMFESPGYRIVVEKVETDNGEPGVIVRLAPAEVVRRMMQERRGER